MTPESPQWLTGLKLQTDPVPLQIRILCDGKEIFVFLPSERGQFDVIADGAPGVIHGGCRFTVPPR